MNKRHARQIRAGIKAAHLPHRLLEYWTITERRKVSALTLKAFLRTRERMRLGRIVGPKYSPNLNDGVDFSKIHWTYDPAKED